MSFDYALFPVPLQALGIDNRWSTTVVELGGGNEQRNINWSAIRREYDALTGIVTQASFDLVQSHFNARQGMGYSFPLLDKSFYKISIPVQFGIGTGSQTDFQLNFNIGDATRNQSYNIYLPISGTVRIFDNATEKFETTHWTLPYSGATAGLLHFLVAPVVAHSLTMILEFYIPVRYDVDDLNTKLFVWNNQTKLYEGPQIPLKEVRYPGEWV